MSGNIICEACDFDGESAKCDACDAALCPKCSVFTNGSFFCDRFCAETDGDWRPNAREQMRLAKLAREELESLCRDE